MLVTRQWSDESDLFEVVASALFEIDDSEAVVRCQDEPDGYGERGVVSIRTPDGRRFRLSLSEEI